MQELNEKITEKDVFKIHKLTTQGILDSSYHNRRRNDQNAVYNE